jgi:chromosome segregation ATPase
MKKAVIFLSIISLALVAALFLRSQRADNQLESAQKEIVGISNQLSEAQIKLNHQERMNTSFKSQLEEREARVATLTNDLNQVRSSLTAARDQNAVVQQNLADLVARADALVAERDALSNQMNELELSAQEQERLLREAQVRVLTAETNSSALSQQLASEQAQKHHLEDVLKTPAALENQLQTLRTWDSAAKSPRTNGTPDYRLPLQLQADGSVTLAAPPEKNSAN